MLSTPNAPVLDSQGKGFPLSGHLAGALLRVWTMFPTEVRVLAYELLRKAGERLYGKPNDYSTVQRLPFGLYLKYQGEPEGFRNEFNALRTVRRHTTIPVPRPLDLVTKKGDRNDPFSSPESYLLIARLPGIPLSRCQHVLSDPEYEEIATQLRDYVTQLRSIRNEANPDMSICNTLGEAIRDPRIHSGDPIGPFPDEAAFSQHLRFSDEPSRRGHKVLFTHADLNPRNILVDRARLSHGQHVWRVSGIVDWENSGYYPEYWDYTKAMFEGFRWTFRHNEMVKRVFSEFGDYSAESEVEKRSWESGDGI
jgi:aminoglycoside phosphotransferase (APT) family kinase protein